MKQIKSLLLVGLGSLFFIGCGGGGGGSAASGTSNTSLSFKNQDLTTMNSVAITKNSLSPINSSKLYSAKVLSSPSFALEENIDTNETNTSTLVTEDTVDIYPIYPVTLDIDYFALPTVIRGDTTYLVTSGEFNVTKEDNSTIACNVLVSNYDGSENVKCLYTAKADESTVIPVAVIRDGWIDGELEDFDSVYFIVNNLNDGFTIYKYNGTSLYPVESSDSGKITELLYGKYAIYGYDGTGETTIYVFRNEQNVLDVIPSTLANYNHPLIYRHLALYTNNTSPNYTGIRTLFFDLDTSSSTHYSEDASLNCSTPTSVEKSAIHDYGVIWISADNSKLCEGFEELWRGSTNTLLGFRYLDQSATWESIKISNDVLVGSATFDGIQRLIIEPVIFTGDVATPIDQTAKVYDFNNKLVDADLSSVTSLQYYINGIVINGIKDGIETVRYCNTTSGDCVFETLSSPPAILEQRTDVPQ